MIEYLKFTLPVFMVGAAAFLWANRRVGPAVRRSRWIKFATYVVIVHAVLGATVLGRGAVFVLMAAIVAVGSVEIAHAARRLEQRTRSAILLAFAVIAAGALWFAWCAGPPVVAYLYIVIAVFDGFSQAGGQLLGRTKLAPAISPGKTVEGSIIGAAASIAAAWLLRDHAGLAAPRATAFAAVMAAAGLVGDLAASWVKRRAGIKDYAAILPGHGGVLDRFDSFLAACAAMAMF